MSYITNLAAVSHFQFEKLPCIPSLNTLAVCGCHCFSVFAADFRVRSATTCLAAMNPHYFEYQIVRGVEWIRIYTPGTWRPVPNDAIVHAPTYASTYREWRRSYRFQVYWSEDSTGGTTVDPIVTPSSYVSYHVWEYRDWQTRGYQRLGAPVPAIGSATLVNADANSSVDSSVPDGAWREPSPPPFYDPWNDSE